MAEKVEIESSVPALKVVENTDDLSPDDAKDVNMSAAEYQMPSKKEEEALIKKKYGGLLPKKPPLISKDSDRAFFDSADWALGKKSKGPVEALRPKLQRTTHPQTRSRSAYARPGDGEDVIDADNLNIGDENGDKVEVNPEENQDNEGCDGDHFEKEKQPN